jgi:isoleucyl-tRNA synthetase
MSKRDKNYPDPWNILEGYGADALRLYMLSSPVVIGEQLNFSEREIDEVSRKVLNLLWNVTLFYKTYAGNERIELAKPRSAHVLDRWILARLHSLIRDVTVAYDSYDIVEAVRPLRGFIDDLSTWWLRRSRDRIRGTDAYDRMDALKTLREVLLDTAALIAPAAPFIADRVYLEMEGLKASVHLERWPKEDTRLIDVHLMEDMERLREAVSVGLEQRALTKLPIRQALTSATIRVGSAADAQRLSGKPDLLELIRAELNVEAVRFETGSGDHPAVELDTHLTPELKAKGYSRELIRHVMAYRKTLGLQPQDEVDVRVAIQNAALREMISSQLDAVKSGVRARSVLVEESAEAAEEGKEIELDGSKVELRVVKIG